MMLEHWVSKHPVIKDSGGTCVLTDHPVLDYEVGIYRVICPTSMIDILSADSYRLAGDSLGERQHTATRNMRSLESTGKVGCDVPQDGNLY
ncbi:hypothetical protein BPSY_0277 [Bifidobacterium psychraerophilum]|jgi:hypothetical protein|uniref:Uncharacterized protein n=1 Tax=Bifidobacterium psychraerophilum TaxID=218140 RepID=A0A087CKK7_9BIFI|nr:hypothetical protein BPSY_0277 [Bifidobacterium psychraerophilum]